MKKSDPAMFAQLVGALLTLRDEVRKNTVMLESVRQGVSAMHSSQNLIPALCHALDRLQAEFTALRLQPEPPKAKAKRRARK